MLRKGSKLTSDGVELDTKRKRHNKKRSKKKVKKRKEGKERKEEVKEYRTRRNWSYKGKRIVVV